MTIRNCILVLTLIIGLVNTHLFSHNPSDIQTLQHRLNNEENSETKYELCFKIAELYLRRSTDSTLLYLEKGDKYCSSCRDLPINKLMYFILNAEYNHAIGNAQKAENLLQQALIIAKTLNHDDYLGKIYSQLAYLFIYHQDHQKAKSYLDKAEFYFKTKTNSEFYTYYLFVKGIYEFVAISNFDKMAMYLQKAINLTKQSNQQSSLATLHAYECIYFRLRSKLTESLEKIDQYIYQAKKIGDKLGEAQLLLAKSTIVAKIGNSYRSTHYIEQAESLNQNIKDIRLTFFIKLLKIKRLGDVKEIDKMLKESFSVFDMNKKMPHLWMEYYISFININMVMIYSKMRDTQTRYWYNRTMQTTKLNNNGYAQIYKYYSDYFYGIGNTDSAFYYLKLANDKAYAVGDLFKWQIQMRYIEALLDFDKILQANDLYNSITPYPNMLTSNKSRTIEAILSHGVVLSKLRGINELGKIQDLVNLAVYKSHLSLDSSVIGNTYLTCAKIFTNLDLKHKANLYLDSFSLIGGQSNNMVDFKSIIELESKYQKNNDQNIESHTFQPFNSSEFKYFISDHKDWIWATIILVLLALLGRNYLKVGTKN